MGFLDDLKRQAEEIKAKATTDTSALERNALLADAGCRTAAAYFSSLVQQLNVLQPRAKVVYRLDKKHSVENLKLTDFRADARRKRLREADVFEHVTLRWRMNSGVRMVIVKDFITDIQQMEARLTRSGAKFHAQAIRDQDTNKLHEMRYEFTADFEGAVNIVPDHDAARLRFEIINIEGFETIHVEFPGFEINNARMDELARWIMGEPNTFLKGGQGVRRIEV